MTPHVRTTPKRASGNPPEPYVSIDPAASFLGVSPSWLYRRGDICGVPCYRVGNHRRYRISDLDKWAQATAA